MTYDFFAEIEKVRKENYHNLEDIDFDKCSDENLKKVYKGLQTIISRGFSDREDYDQLSYVQEALKRRGYEFYQPSGIMVE